MFCNLVEKDRQPSGKETISNKILSFAIFLPETLRKIGWMSDLQWCIIRNDSRVFRSLSREFIKFIKFENDKGT